MYRSTSGQTSLFEPQFLLSEFLPENDWSFIFRDKIWPLIDEEKFKHLYQEDGGAPNKSIKLKLSLLIFMSWEKLTWRGTEIMFERRLDWINATCSQLGEKPIDHTTLHKFYDQLVGDDSAYQLFVDLTNSFLDECQISKSKQRTDSFFMHGWLAILSRYGLFKETIRTFLMVLRKHQLELYKNINSELSKDYLKCNFDLTEKNKETARCKTKEMARDLYLLKNAFENHESIKGYDTFKTLVAIFDQQCETKTTEKRPSEKEVLLKNSQADCDPADITKEVATTTKSNEDLSKGQQEGKDSQQAVKASGENNVEENEVLAESEEDIANQGKTDSFENKTISEENQGETIRVEIREKPEGEKIISSPHNTDAEYTRKRKQTVVGHRGFATETCDPNNPFQLVTDVNLEKATHADSKEIFEIERRLEENNLKPEDFYGDAGFVNGESILRSKENGINLEGPSSGRSQSIENHDKKDRPLDVADFKVSIDEQTKKLTVITCPAGICPKDQKLSKITGKILVHFESSDCNACKHCSRCPVKIGSRVSTLTINEAQYAGAERHHRYMEDSDYRKKCAIRSGAESLVNEIANAHGSRRSNHKTEKRSRLQLIFSAISCNVKRYVRYNQEQGPSCVNVVLV